MSTTQTRNATDLTERGTNRLANTGLGDIAVRRDALQAGARAEALLVTIRAIRRGLAAVRTRGGDH